MKKISKDDQHVFILFIFNIFNFLALEIVNLMKRIQKIMHINVVLPKFMNVVF
jgi:hypothetical protein